MLYGGRASELISIGIALNDTCFFLQYLHVITIYNIYYRPHRPFVPATLRDYCVSQYFNVTCPRGAVILMHEAYYGRMRDGKCANNKRYGADDCRTDVLTYMHGRCSARAHCSVYVAEPALHSKGTCPKDLSSFLQAGYQCVTGGLNASASASPSIVLTCYCIIAQRQINDIRTRAHRPTRTHMAWSAKDANNLCKAIHKKST